MNISLWPLSGSGFVRLNQEHRTRGLSKRKFISTIFDYILFVTRETLPNVTTTMYILVKMADEGPRRSTLRYNSTSTMHSQEP
jgi:hypothetical protein